MRHRRLCQLISPEDVDLDRLFGIVLHHGDMLERCRMEDDLRRQLPEELLQSQPIPYIPIRVTDPVCQVGKTPLQSNPQIVQFRLIAVKKDQAARLEGADLHDDLCTDRAAGARNENRLPRDEALQRRRIHGYRLPPDEVFNADLLEPLDIQIRLIEIVDARDYLDIQHPRFPRRLIQQPQRFMVQGGNGDDDCLDTFRRNNVRQLRCSTEHLQIAQIGAHLHVIVV